MKAVALPAFSPVKAQAAKEGPFQKNYVVHLFNTMSTSYEVMNYLTSFGFSYLWRKQFLQPLRGSDQPVQVADFMTGMGETWHPIFTKWQQAHVSALDFSEGMLRYAARKKTKKAFHQKVTLLKADVLENPLPANYFDVVTCAFGLKTLTSEQIRTLAKETHRLLKPNGQFAFIEVSEPTSSWLKACYLVYIRHIMPLIGSIFNRNYQHYKMLGYYTQVFGNAEQAARAFKAEGFSVTYQKFFNGCATGFYGNK